MPKVTCITPDGYRGYDGTTEVIVEDGGTIDVSDAKAAQLKEDFPDWFDFSGKAPRRPRTDDAPADGAQEG